MLSLKIHLRNTVRLTETVHVEGTFTKKTSALFTREPVGTEMNMSLSDSDSVPKTTHNGMSVYLHGRCRT